MVERAGDRVVRLLGLLARTAAAGPEGVSFDQLAAEFGVSARTIRQDAELLWVTGLPGYGYEDLIDFDPFRFDAGRLAVLDDQNVGRPLRLGPREAAVLIAALRALDESWGPSLPAESRDLLAATLAVLTRAAGEAAASGVGVRLVADADPTLAATLAEAVRTRRRLRLTYVTGADVTREREVDPWSVLTGEEHSYLRAWCHTAGDERLFRLDRVLAAEILPAEVTVPVPEEPAPGSFRPGPDAARVTLALAHRARWVAEQLPVAEVVDTEDGLDVTLEVASDAWLTQLLLRLAPDVRGVTPPDAAHRAAAAARAALARYEGTD